MNDFKKLMQKLGIDVNEIEVVDPEIVTPETEVDRFYKWLQMCGNQHLANDEKMERAFNKIN
jgi:NACalpha-BTF3-like transcription factor